MSRIYTLKKDHEDLRDHHFSSKLFQHRHQLPEEVDLRSMMSPIVDQGQLGSCTANAIASGLMEYLFLQKGQPLERLSRLFLYYEERAKEGTIDQDAGAMIRDGMKVAEKFGVCPETDYPYDITKFTQPPTHNMLVDAQNYKLKHYHRVNTVHALQTALAEALPVVIGIDVYESFESQDVARTGVVPLPNTRREQCLGGHAVCVVGYKKIDGNLYFIVRNSWGIGWGDKGYFYLPVSFFGEFVSDMWTGLLK